MAKQFTFAAGDWAAGAANRITVKATGVPGPGELGPHELPTGGAYHVSVFNSTGAPITVGVDAEIEIALATGDVTIKKAGLATPFAGRVVISSALIW